LHFFRHVNKYANEPETTLKQLQKIYMVSLLHRVTIKQSQNVLELFQL